MESLLNALPWIVGGLVLVAVLAALRKPLQWLVRVLARTGVGLAVLFKYNRHWKENLLLAAILYVSAVATGLVCGAVF